MAPRAGNPLLNRPCRRFTLVDAAAVLLIAAAVCLFFWRMKTLLDYRWEWQAIPQYFLFRDANTGHLRANILLKGFFTTVKLSIWAMIPAFFLGVVSGIMGASKSRINRIVSSLYVETMRNIPSLVLVILFYYFISSQFLDLLALDQWLRQQPGAIKKIFQILLGDHGTVNTFLSAIAALAIYEGAYISEIIRGGINAVPAGQREAARALGLSGLQTFGAVILPQAVKKVASPLAGQFISTVKDSAIMSVISVQELTFQGMELMSATFLTFEIWITITGLYFVLTFTLSRSVAALNSRASDSGAQ